MQAGQIAPERAADLLSGAMLDKQVNGIVSGSTVRLQSLRDVPTAAEEGLPKFKSQGWNALFVLKRTSEAPVAKLIDAARSETKSPWMASAHPCLVVRPAIPVPLSDIQRVSLATRRGTREPSKP